MEGGEGPPRRMYAFRINTLKDFSAGKIGSKIRQPWVFGFARRDKRREVGPVSEAEGRKSRQSGVGVDLAPIGKLLNCSRKGKTSAARRKHARKLFLERANVRLIIKYHRKWRYMSVLLGVILRAQSECKKRAAVEARHCASLRQKRDNLCQP